MKAVMYHYVRPVPADLPHFRYLHADNFRRQLDWLAATTGFASRDAFMGALAGGPVPGGAVLTFDDAFSDHYDHVFHELAARGLWGVFYVPTAVLESDRLLDVHRIHVLLGRVGGTRALAAAMPLVDDTMLSHGTVEAFRRQTYMRQDNDADTTTFKRVMNYFISYEHRTGVLDRLMAAFGMDASEEAAFKRSFYVDAGQLRGMADGGMTIGSHGANHLLMSKLSEVEQRAEIHTSFRALADLLDTPVETFCYPYGGFHSFDATTERLLGAAGARYSFNVEPRDVIAADLSGRPQALPRWDCNAFPHGTAHYGPMAQA